MIGSRRRLSIVFVNHSGFHSNSAHHIAGFAGGLHARGHRVKVIAEGSGAESGLPVGMAVELAQAFLPESGLAPLLGDPSTIVHAWTPRERVRVTVERLTRGRLRHVVHLEDHEEEITSAFLDRPWDQLSALSEVQLDRLVPDNLSHPTRYRRFLRSAAGATVIVDPLRKLLPAGCPTLLLEPGIDTDHFRPRLTDYERAELRRDLGVGAVTTLVFHPGAMHAANAADVSALYAAVRRLRAEGRDMVLVRTGEGAPVAGSEDSEGVRQLGFIPRGRLIDLLDLSDICVQPGGPTRFNQYRFPSKLPEFFAMGRATITAAANVGLRLKGGREALLLRTGDVDELVRAIALLDDQPRLCRRLGDGARRFARRKLKWADKVRALERFYLNLNQSIAEGIPAEPCAIHS